MLLLGAWVGGRHSDWLPGPAARRARRRQRHRGRPGGDRPRPRHLLPRDPQVGAGRRRDRRAWWPSSTTASPTTSIPPSTSASRTRRTPSSRASACRSAKHPQGPARRGGLRRLARQARRPAPGGRHRRRRRARPGRGCRRTASVALVKGPPGSAGAADLDPRRRAHTKTVSRSTVTVPVVASQLRSERRLQGRRRAPVAVQLGRARRGLRRAAQAPEARRQGLRARPARQRRRPGLRGAAHRLGLPRRRADRHHARAGGQGADAARHRRSGRAQGAARGARQQAAPPRPRRSSPARCRTASARRSWAPRPSARASSRRSSSSPTAARWTSPPGSTSRPRAATSAARASRRARASSPTCRPRTIRRRASRRGARPGDGRRRRQVPVLTHAPPRVVLLEQRGRFLVGEPFFERGRRVTVERSRDARPGRLALLHPNPKGGRFKIARVLGRPDVARDVIEALMLDRGLRRSFPPGVERAAAGRPAARRRRAATSPTLPTFTIDPVTARDFDDAISCEALGDEHWRVWVHIADVAAYVRPGGAVDREAYRRSTSVYVPGAVEPMLPEALSNDACSLRPGVERLAVTVELELRGAETVKARLLPLAHPLRRAPGLRPRRPASSPARRPRRTRGPSRWRRRARRRPRCRRGARAAARWPSSRSSPSSPSTAAATSSRRWRRCRPSRTGSSST